MSIFKRADKVFADAQKEIDARRKLPNISKKQEQEQKRQGQGK